MNPKVNALRSNSARQVADQYKPAPGSPYRPVLSPPQQIYELQLGWSDCTITHAFAGIDPPRSLVPAAALVPNLTPTSPQSHGTETTLTSSPKPVSGAVEAGSTGATRDPSAAPAHKIQSAGPRSTPSPSSSSIIENDHLEPESLLDQQHTEAVEADIRASKWQTPVSPKAVSKSHTSYEKAKDSSIQSPSKDGSFTSRAISEVSRILSDAFRSPGVSSVQRSAIRSALSPNAVAPNSLSTREDKHEEGVSIPATGTTRDPSSEVDHGQKVISSNLKASSSRGSLPQESKYTQGIITAEPGSPRPETLSDCDVSTRNRNPPYQTDGRPIGPFTHIIADPSKEPASVFNSERYADIGASIGSSIHAAVQSSPYGPLPNEQGEQQSQTSSSSPNADGGLMSVDMSASKAFLDVKPDFLTSATSTGPTAIPQMKSDPLLTAISIPFKEPSELRSDLLIDPPASIGRRPTNSISNSSTHEPPAPANAVASKQYPNVTAYPPPPLSIPSSDDHSVPADTNALACPQSWPSNSTKPIFGNQTAPILSSSGASTVSGQAGASSFTSKGVRGNTTVLPFKSGEERETISCFTRLIACFGHILLWFLV